MTTDSTPSASNSPSNSTSNPPLNPTAITSSSSSSLVTVNNGNDVNDVQTQIIHHSTPPSPSSSTPTPQPSTSHPSSDIENDIDPVDNARSAASISNLINHDVEQRVNTNSSSPKSQPTSQLSSRSISPVPPETPHNTNNNVISGNEQRLTDIEFHNTNNSSLSKKKRKGDHDNDENDIGNNDDFDSSKRQRKNLSLSGEGISDDNVTKISTAPSSPVTSGFDEIIMDDHNSDEYSVANSPTQISSSSSSMGNNINFISKQTRKKPYIPRPPNSFILYRQHHHPLILNQHPGINNSEISRIIADHWRNLSTQDKEEWKRKAEEAKERHMKAWPDYKYQPRRRVVGPTFKKPIKGPGAPSTTTKSDAFSAQEGMMDNFVIELSPRKIDHNDNLMESRERQRFQGKSVIIIEGGSKELKDRNGNNSPRKPSPAEAIKAKLGTGAHQLPAYSSHMAQRLPPPCTLVPPQLQPLPSPQQPQGMILPTTPSSTSSPRGALIVLEGCEESTTLQSNQLHKFLKNEGIKAELWKFPDTSTPSGNALKAYQSVNRQSNPKMLHLLVAAHWWELIPKMREQLMSGITLIVDRYINSAIAESVAAGLDLPWCKTSYAQSLSPDLIFFLNVEREASEMDKQKLSQMPQLSLPHVNDVLGISNNAEDGRIVKECQRRIQDALARLAEVQWKILDARKSNTIINAQIITASIEVIEKCRKSNAGYGNTIMSHQNQQLPPLVPISSQQSQYPPVSGSPQPNHSLLPLSHQQQQNSNVLPPIGRHDFSRSVHVQL